MKYACSLSLLLILFLTANCEKDIPSKTLPPITQEGKNTAGFLLDGEVWVPFAKCTYFGNPCEEIFANYGPPYNFNNYLSFQIEREFKDNSSTLTISSLIPIKEAGEYLDSIYVSFFSEEKDINTGHRIEFTNSSSLTTGNFTILRLDTIEQIMSGTFSFTLSNRKGKTIEITDGRFDFEMSACICR